MKKKGAVVAKAKKKTPAKKSSAKKKAKKPTVRKAAVKAVKKTAKKISKPTAKKTAKPGVIKAAPTKTAPVKRDASLAKARPAHLKLVTDMSAFVTPLDDRVLVRLTGTDRKTPGGLFIPETVADTSGNLEGLVVAIGRGRRNKKGQIRPMDVQLGDRIVFAEYAGSKIRIQNEDLVLLREAEVMGVLS